MNDRTDMGSIEIPVTALVKKYRSVKALRQRDQLALAEELMADPSILPALFAQSVDDFRGWDNAGEPFHPPRHGQAPNQNSHTAVFVRA